MKYEKGSFIVVPNSGKLSGLDPQTQCLFMWLCFFANQEGECFPSRATLANKTGMSDNTVDRKVKELIAFGFIEKENRFVNGEAKSNLYHIIIGGVAPHGGHLAPHGGQGVAPHGGRELNPSSLTQSNEDVLHSQNPPLVVSQEEETLYDPAVKQTYKSKAKIMRQMGHSFTPRAVSPKQQKMQDVFFGVINHFKQAGYTMHGMQFFKVQDARREKAVRMLATRAFDTLGSISECKALIDWWFEGEGEWAQYEPENCFSSKTMERFINRAKIEEAKREPIQVVGALKFYTKDEVEKAEKEGIIKWDARANKWLLR